MKGVHVDPEALENRQARHRVHPATDRHQHRAVVLKQGMALNEGRDRIDERVGHRSERLWTRPTYRPKRSASSSIENFTVVGVPVGSA
jgi:hypothetical protein